MVTKLVSRPWDIGHTNEITERLDKFLVSKDKQKRHYIYRVTESEFYIRYDGETIGNIEINKDMTVKTIKVHGDIHYGTRQYKRGYQTGLMEFTGNKIILVDN